MPFARPENDRGASSGFTLAELVTVIAIVGVLAAVAIPRFVGTSSFESRGFYDQAMGIVRYAQKAAIAWRRTIFVCVTGTAVSAGAAAGCASPLVHPVNGSLLTTTAPSGVSLSTASCGSPATGNFSFDGIGRPSANTTITVCSTIAGDPARQIVVESETGYVHP